MMPLPFVASIGYRSGESDLVAAPRHQAAAVVFVLADGVQPLFVIEDGDRCASFRANVISCAAAVRRYI
jgi:hypothetical protein